MNLQLTSNSDRETEQIAAKLAARLKGGDVIALEGPLGAGKTCFVRGLARGLHIDANQVSSPTFILSQEYTGENSPTLVHIDAYRFHGASDLESIGWEELVSSTSVIIAIEWPSRIAEALRDVPSIKVNLEPISPSSRLLTIHARNALAARLEGFHE